MNPDQALIAIGNYIAKLETILSSVDLTTREYLEDYDYADLPETHEELMDWMDKNRTMVYNCLQTVDDALYEVALDDNYIE